MTETPEQFKQRWIDCLDAFGARLEIDVLPDWIENRTRSAWLPSDDEEAVEDRPVRMRIVGRQYVTGPVLVELDANRQKIVAAFSR
jgi:hypothetical protein